jgi:hypothetical protein
MKDKQICPKRKLELRIQRTRARPEELYDVVQKRQPVRNRRVLSVYVPATKENATLFAAAPDLHEFAAMVARMKTDEEYGDDMPASEDWVSTLNSLIAFARSLVAKAKS